jgi:hypothetical protein
MTSVLNLSTAQLRAVISIKERIEKLEGELASLIGGSESPTPVAGRRSMSAAGRARVAAAQRARWAKTKVEATAETTRKKRKMSATAKAKIAAAARARWAKAKAAGKNRL